VFPLARQASGPLQELFPMAASLNAQAASALQELFLMLPVFPGQAPGSTQELFPIFCASTGVGKTMGPNARASTNQTVSRTSCPLSRESL